MYLTPITAFVISSLIFAESDTMTWLDYASRIGVIGILVVSHYGFHKGWWVYGSVYNDLQKRYEARGERIKKLEEEKDQWKESALTGQRVAERSTTIASAALTRARRNER